MMNKLDTFFVAIRDRLKPHLAQLVKLGLLGLTTITIVITLLLVIEYRFFKHQTEKMLEIKEDYRNYVVAVKKILHDYHKNKERLEELETMLEEKKKDNEDAELGVAQTGFPDGVRVYSSDDEEEDSFLPIVINRDLEHLKQSSLDYLKKQRVGYLADYFEQYLWLDYTDQVELERSKEAQKGRKGRVRRRRYATHRRQAKQTGVARGFGRVKKHKVTDINFSWPIDRSNFWLSSFFGPRRKPNGLWGFHNGIDMAAVRGTTVKSAASGVVVEAQYSSGYGKTVVVAHNQKYRTRYAHLNSIMVKVGQKVEANQKIGTVGATGFVRSKRGGDASHLHFEVYVFGKQVNPMYFLG